MRPYPAVNACLVVAVALFISCAPEKDILERFEGAYAVVDNIGMRDNGCMVKIIAGNRVLTLWHYDDSGEIVTEDYPLDHFSLIDLYSRNYGTLQPTWIYSYGPSEGEFPRFYVFEYFNGRLNVSFASEALPPDVPTAFLAAILPDTVPSDTIPPILTLDSPEVATPFLEVRELTGRYFLVSGTIDVVERVFTEGYAPYAGSMFGDGFYIDMTRLNPVTAGPWSVFAQLRSEDLPGTIDQDLPPPQRSFDFPVFGRLREVREDPNFGPNALVMMFDY